MLFKSTKMYLIMGKYGYPDKTMTNPGVRMHNDVK